MVFCPSKRKTVYTGAFFSLSLLANRLHFIKSNPSFRATNLPTPSATAKVICSHREEDICLVRFFFISCERCWCAGNVGFHGFRHFIAHISTHFTRPKVCLQSFFVGFSEFGISTFWCSVRHMYGIRYCILLCMTNISQLTFEPLSFTFCHIFFLLLFEGRMFPFSLQNC